MFLIVAILGAVLILLQIRRSLTDDYGLYTGSVLNPGIFVAAIFGVFWIDFLAFYLAGYTEISETPYFFDGEQIARGMLRFVIYAAAFLTGSALMGRRFKSVAVVRTEAQIRGSEAVGGLVLAVGLLAAGIGYLLALRQMGSIGAFFRGLASRQTFLGEFRTTFLLITGLIPCAAVYVGLLSRITPARLVPVIPALLMLLGLGSRNSVALVGLVIVARLVRQGMRFPVWLYLPGLPLGAILGLFVAFQFRNAEKYGNFFTYLQNHGGAMGALFNTVEIGGAEAITIITDMPDLKREPFDSFKGLIGYPIPRETWPDKPPTPGALFTETIFPTKWEQSKSEILTSGFGDMQMMFGPYGATVAFLLLGVGWRWAIRTSLVGGPISQGILYPYVVYWTYVFFRGDIQILGNSMWPLLVVTLGTRILHLFSGGGGTPLPRPAALEQGAPAT